jgi:FkbM family methyltransferase
MIMLLPLLGRMPRSWIRAAGSLRGRSRWLKSMTDWLPALLRHRDGRIQRGLGRGLRFNGADSAVGFLLGTHDPDVQFAMGRLLQPGMTVYDIGANVGFTAVIAARQVASEGKVVCFEPLAGNAAQIQHNAELNQFTNIEVRQLALGPSDGAAEFRVSESPTWGRLAMAGAAPRQRGIEQVVVRSLDSLAGSEGLPPPQVIKLDVEGAEADVIAGGKQLIATARPVMVIELHHTYAAVLDVLSGLDYTVQPLTRGGELAAHDGEFQVLAYPHERRDVETVWSDWALGKAVLP